MRNNKLVGYALIAVCLFMVFTACNRKPRVEVLDFELFTNFDFPGDTLTLEMDLTNAPFGGVTIPSAYGKDGQRQFKFSFTAMRTGGKDEPLAYKIYYQNESYKHPEVTGTDTIRYNERSRENFYGSWISDTLIGFKKTLAVNRGEMIRVVDSVYIAGNPMNREQFYGGYIKPYNLTNENITKMIRSIESNPSWYEMVKEKATNRKTRIEDQLLEDAVWTLKNKFIEVNENQRWQNNPRVGSYRFMLVVGSEKSITQLPDYVSHPDVLKESGLRVNPFYYFRYGEGSENRALAVQESEKVLKTFAVLRPQHGVYFDPYEYSVPISTANKGRCVSDSMAFHNAHFRQYLNTVYMDQSLNNVKSTADIAGTSYSRNDYERAVQNKNRDSTSYVSRPKAPCINASYSAAENAILLRNPGNKQPPYLKENAGTEGRIGFTYGKFRARIRFPEILSNDNVWNGITCAYWLKMESIHEWNNRDSCFTDGYRSKGLDTDYGNKVPVSAYSEIDIEIVKASRYWPKTSYSNADTIPYYDPGLDHNLIVTCTNWDLSCPDPVNYGVGVQRITHGSKTYYPHRWDTWYQAMTLKTERPHNETVGDVYLYEIDWRPNEIIWRIGATENNMTEVGYMNETITKIPNNQMVPVVSQEFHYGDWWPTTPFHQSHIPYPKNPITGMVYEIVIE